MWPSSFIVQSPIQRRLLFILEEAGVPYDLVPINLLKGEQFSPDYLSVNPNGKVPAILDGQVSVFDSNAILLYLADKTGMLLGANTPETRGSLLSWLMFIGTGVGPFSGQAAHFRHYAPEQVPYALQRYLFEANRHYKIIDTRLSQNRYMLGSDYTIVDMAIWPWTRLIPYILGDDEWATLLNIKRFKEEIDQRPAAIRALSLKGTYDATAELDDQARQFLFAQVTGAAAH